MVVTGEPRYIHCDRAECPIRWDHWHLRNPDGTRAGDTNRIMYGQMQLAWYGRYRRDLIATETDA